MSDALEGQILSRRYLVGASLGEGGMGTVYRATDLRTGGTVAVKIVRPELAADGDYIARLRREAQLAAAVDSPRVVRIVDLDHEGGVTYLVMEYVDGATLAELVRGGPLATRKALHIAREIAFALEALHTRGIVHRDLKPHNIKVDPGGAVKLIDFGIARAEGVPGVTSTGLFIGSVTYAAPERIDGRVDIRSDIYAVGVILYELLAGRPPFEGALPMAVLDKHLEEPPPPLPASVPAKTREVVERCLAKRPDNRYQTPRELVQALTAAIADQGGTAEVRAAVEADVAGTGRPAPAPTPAAPAPTAGAAPAASRRPAISGRGRRLLLAAVGAGVALLLLAVAAVTVARAAAEPYASGGPPPPALGAGAAYRPAYPTTPAARSSVMAPRS